MELVRYLRHHIISYIHNKTYRNDASEYYIQKRRSASIKQKYLEKQA